MAGRLPLALLSLAGALVARGTTWTEARDAFDRERVKVERANPRLSRQLAQVYARIRVSVGSMRKTSPATWERISVARHLGTGRIGGSRPLRAALGLGEVGDARRTLVELAEEALLHARRRARSGCTPSCGTSPGRCSSLPYRKGSAVASKPLIAGFWLRSAGTLISARPASLPRASTHTQTSSGILSEQGGTRRSMRYLPKRTRGA